MCVLTKVVSTSHMEQKELLLPHLQRECFPPYEKRTTRLNFEQANGLHQGEFQSSGAGVVLAVRLYCLRSC